MLRPTKQPIIMYTGQGDQRDSLMNTNSGHLMLLIFSLFYHNKKNVDAFIVFCYDLSVC